MKVLVCVASKYGATAEIARAVADVLAERGCEVTVIPSEEVGAIEEFDAVVLGSAVYMGQWMKPARELVERSSAALAARPVGCSPAAQLASRPSPPTAPSTSRRSSRPPSPRPPDLHRQAGQEAPQLPRPGDGLGRPRRRGRLPQLGRHPRLGRRHRRHPALLMTGDSGSCHATPVSLKTGMRSRRVWPAVV